jgi:hypothetical protein
MLNKVKIKLFIFLFFLSVLAGCAGTGTKNYSSVSYEAPSDQAVVFIGRKNRFVASAGLVKVILDGQEIARLGIGEMERVTVSAGSHKLQSKIGNVLQLGVGGDSSSFVAEKGKKYFFIVDFDTKLFSSQWVIMETTEGGFQSSIN